MAVSARFRLHQLIQDAWYPEARTARFAIEEDLTIAPDDRAMLATPIGELELRVDNPKALEQLKIGGRYRIELIPCDGEDERAKPESVDVYTDDPNLSPTANLFGRLMTEPVPADELKVKPKA